MKKRNPLILIDSMINLFLGVILLIYTEPVINFFGLPVSEQYFYPNILGAILFGIGIALLIEYRRKGDFIGLGLGGAIMINLAGGVALFIWLVSGTLTIPLKGKIILWIIDIILLVISSFELFSTARGETRSS